MELDFQVLICHFGPVYQLQVSKNDDEERRFKNNLALKVQIPASDAYNIIRNILKCMNRFCSNF